MLKKIADPIVLLKIISITSRERDIQKYKEGEIFHPPFNL